MSSPAKEAVWGGGGGVLPGILRAGCPVWKEPAGKALSGNLVTPQGENTDLAGFRPTPRLAM